MSEKGKSAALAPRVSKESGTPKIAPPFPGPMGFDGMADLGARPMQPGDNMAADQVEAARAAAAEEARAMAMQYASDANKMVANTLMSLADVGAIQQYKDAGDDRTKTQQLMEGPQKKGPPVFPGTVYVNHLLKRGFKERAGIKPSGTEELNIYTTSNEALKAAIQALGVYSDRNPGGMPIDLKVAQKVWFGSGKTDDIQVAEWRSLVEMGDRLVDPKKIRKFTNYDGSLTWELLNEDKTVSSRFTLGEYQGVKLFAQGGYNKFVELLNQLKTKMGPKGSEGFDAVRDRFFGGSK